MALTRFIFLLVFWDYYSSIIEIGKNITRDILKVLRKSRGTEFVFCHQIQNYHGYFTFLPNFKTNDP